MKSERRHQLETNILADWLGKNLEALESHKTTIAVGFAIFLALGLVVVFANSGADPAAANQWRSYYSAFVNNDPTPDLEKFVKEQKLATPAVFWGKKALADRYLARGTQMLFLNQKEAKEKLEDAEKLYVEIEKNAGTQTDLRNEARFGLARTAESLGRIDEAKKIMGELVKLGNESSLGKAAAESLKRLENPRTVEALAWFAQQKPALPKGHPNLGGIGGDLPDRPDLSFPGQEKPKAPSSLEDNPDDPAPKPDDKKTPAEQPGEAKPEENKPAETKPAESNSTDKPAESKPADPKAEDKPVEKTPENK